MLSSPRNVNVDLPGRAPAPDGNHSAGPEPTGGGGGGGGSTSNGVQSGAASPDGAKQQAPVVPGGRGGGGRGGGTGAGAAGGQQRHTGPHDYSASWKIGTTDGYLRATPAYNSTMGQNRSSGHHQGMSLHDAVVGPDGERATPSPPPHPINASAPEMERHRDEMRRADEWQQQEQAAEATQQEQGVEVVRQGVAALSATSSSGTQSGGGGSGSANSSGSSGAGGGGGSASASSADSGAGAPVVDGPGGGGSGHQQQQQQQQRQPTLSVLSQQQTPGGPSTEFRQHQHHEQRISGGGGRSSAPPSLPPPVPAHQSLYQDRLFNQPSTAVEAVLSASCEAMGFDIAEMWLRTGPKTHQLTNSHLRPTALEDSVRAELVDVYYGEMSSQRTHRLSPALCKRAKEAQDVVWVTANTERGAEALRCSISDVRTAVAVPVCHEVSNTNITLIFFSIRRAIMRPEAVEFLVHMSLSAAVSSVNSLAEDIMVDEQRHAALRTPMGSDVSAPPYAKLSRSEHIGDKIHRPVGRKTASRRRFSVTGSCLDLKWNHLKNVEYLTDGGNNWIHTAVMNGRPVVVKTLKPECQDLALAINEIEGELQIHSKLDHPNIVGLLGAGTTSKGSRFVVLERLDGGTLTQHLGYDTRIRDRRRRFWKKKQFSYLEVLTCARSVSDAMAYCHGSAIPGSMVLHRDLKPDNIGFTLDGTVKLIDFGLARVVDNASPDSDEVYQMSGETGSLRYMAPEVADCQPYNHKADVYSFGMILWEIVAYKKPFDGMNREQFYARVVHGGERPPLGKKWPEELVKLIQECWDADPQVRPTFANVAQRIHDMLMNEKGGGGKKVSAKKRISALIDRHSTWF